MSVDPKVAYAIRQLQATVQALQQELSTVKQSSDTLEDEINKLPGRRVLYTLMGTQTFTASNDGSRGNPITFEVSQDGPFVMTHYPVVMWRPSTPSNATNFGRWRPVSSWSIPAQSGITDDIIDISYEMVDSGSGRELQNNIAVHPGLLSTPDEWKALPIPVYFRPQSVISFTPTYENIAFASGGTATTGGTLAVALPGYKIVNLG